MFGEASSSTKMESEAHTKSLEDGSGLPEENFLSYEEESSSPLDGNSGNPEDIKTQHDKQIENVCIFCQQNEDNDFKFGKLCHLEDTSNGRMLTAHHYCLFFASGLCQKGSDNEGIQGFLANDIQKEVSRASRLKCSFCMKKGASVGCCIKKCRQCYHYPCGRDNGSLFRFYKDFVSFCATHRPCQEFSTAEAMNLSLVKCPVCLDEVPNEPGCDVLKTPCCHNTFLHRDCIQQQALASGYYFFRCPICNNQKEFRDEMKLFGIHVPEQDAAWEREEGAFQELYQRHNKCDVEDCLCPKGNEHCTTQGKWQIVLCDFCGSVGCHVECGRLERPSQDWACSSCRGMLSTGASNGVLFESTPCKKKGRARSSMKFKGKTPRAGIKNKKVKKSTGTIEVDVDTDSPSTSRDGITDDFKTTKKEKRKKKRVKKMKEGDKKKGKSSQPPTLTRADLSPVRPVLSGDGPKTPKLSPIWDNFVIGKKHNGKGFKRHTFGKNCSSKFKGQSIFLKKSQSQKQSIRKGAGKAGGGKKKSQKAFNGTLDSSSKQGGSSVWKSKTGKTSKGSQATGNEKLTLSTTLSGDEILQVVESETSSKGKKKVPKSQHAVIFQSQSKLFQSGCPMRAKQDVASAFMKRSLATIKGELVSNLPLVRLCKMALAEGDDLEQVQAFGWKRALISTTKEMTGKKEAGSEGNVRARLSRMSMRKRVDKKIGPSLKKKPEQGVVRSTRSKINSEQLSNDILQESAKNILHAVLTGSKPVDLESYLQHRSKSEEIITGENTREKEVLGNPSVLLVENEGENLTSTEDSTIDEIIICSPEKQEEKDGFVDMNESDVINGLEPGKKQCLRSFSKSSDSEANNGTRGTIGQMEEKSAKLTLDMSVVSPSKLKDDLPKQKVSSSDSVSEKGIAEDDKSDTLGMDDKPVKNGNKVVNTKSSTKGGRDGLVKSAPGKNESCAKTLTVVDGSVPGLCSSKEDQIPVGDKVTRASVSNSLNSLSMQVSGATRKTDKVQKKMAQESLSVIVLDKNVGSGVRSSPRLGSTSKVSSLPNVNESTMKDKQTEVDDGKSSPSPHSSDKVQKKRAQESPSVKVLNTNVENGIRSSPRLGTTSRVSSFQNVNDSTMKDTQIEIEDGKISPLLHSSPQITKSSPLKEVSGLGKTTGVFNNLSSHNIAGKLRSSPRLRSTELLDVDQKSATDTLLKQKSRNQKPVNKEQGKTSMNENTDATDHDTRNPLRVSPVSEDKDQKSPDPQNDGQEDVSIIAVFTNKEKVTTSPQQKCQLAAQSDKKGNEGSTSLKRKIAQQSPQVEGGVLQKIVKSNHMSYEDVYKQEEKDSSKNFSKKDSRDEGLGGKSVRHSKGNATGHRRSSSECSEDVAILGVFKTGPTHQRKVKIEVLSQVQAKEKRSTPSLRSEKRKRAKCERRDVDQESLKETILNTNSKETGESSPSSVKSSSPEANDPSKPKAKKTLNDYFQATDKKSQLSGNDVKRTVSSVVRNIPTSSPMVKPNSSITKSSAAKANSPVVKINPCSLSKPVAPKTNTSIVTVNSSVVKANPSSQTKPTEDVTIVGIFKRKILKDSHKECHVPNTSKDAHHSQHRESMPKADLSNKKLHVNECTKRVGKTLTVSTTSKTLSDRNISEHIRKSATEIMAQRGVRIEPRLTQNRQCTSSGNTSQYVLSSDYVSYTPSPQRRKSNHYYRNSQYSWPLPKRELDMDVVILDTQVSSGREVKRRSRLFTDGTEENLQVSNEASLSFSPPCKQPSSDTRKEQKTKVLATTPEGNSLKAKKILSGKPKQPPKRKCCEMEGVDASTAEPLPSPNKENSNLNTTEQGKIMKDNQEAGLSHTKGETAKEDSVSKRRSKRLKKDDSSGCDVYDFTDEEDIFPQGESKDSQEGQLNEANLQHCKTTGKLHGKVSVEDVEKRQTTPQKRMLLQRPLSLCKVVVGDNEEEAAISTRRKCNSDLKVKKPLTVQKISRRQLVM